MQRGDENSLESRARHRHPRPCLLPPYLPPLSPFLSPSVPPPCFVTLPWHPASSLPPGHAVPVPLSSPLHLLNKAPHAHGLAPFPGDRRVPGGCGVPRGRGTAMLGFNLRAAVGVPWLVAQKINSGPLRAWTNQDARYCHDKGVPREGRKAGPERLS